MSKVHSTLRREKRSILISTAALWATFQTRRQTHRGLVCAWVCLVSGWRIRSAPGSAEGCPGRQMLFWTPDEWYTVKLIVSVLAMLWQKCVLDELWMHVFSSKWSELWEDGGTPMWNVQAASAFCIVDVKGGIYYVRCVYGGDSPPFSRKSKGGGQKWTHRYHTSMADLFASLVNRQNIELSQVLKMTYVSWFKCIVGNASIWKPWLKFVLTESSTESGQAHTVPARRSARLSKLGSLSTKTSSSDIRQNVSPKHKTRQTSKQKQKGKSKSNQNNKYYKEKHSR